MIVPILGRRYSVRVVDKYCLLRYVLFFIFVFFSLAMLASQHTVIRVAGWTVLAISHNVWSNLKQKGVCK